LLNELQKTLKCPFNHLENDKIYDNSLYSMLYFSFPKCIKTHIRACRISKIFRGSHPDPEHWLEEDEKLPPPWEILTTGLPFSACLGSRLLLILWTYTTATGFFSGCSECFPFSFSFLLRHLSRCTFMWCPEFSQNAKRKFWLLLPFNKTGSGVFFIIIHCL